MWTALKSHLALCLEHFGAGWNRFWFTPSDPVTLAALRIAAGLIALYWQLCYTPDLVEFFGSHGIIPVPMLQQWQGNAAVFTYFGQTMSPAVLLLLHFAGTAILLLFTLGVFTRVTSVLALLVALSYIHRGPMLTAQMEPILALVMFYLTLGPSGAVWSVDAWRRQRDPQLTGLMRQVAPSAWATVPVRLIQVHITAVYIMMALAKVAGPAWWNGSAIWWLTARPESQGFWIAQSIAPYLNAIEAWTHAVVLFELAFPILVWNRYSRPFALLLSVPMWVLLALATGLNTFAAIMLVANLAFVSPTVLRILARQADPMAGAANAASPRAVASGSTARTNFAGRRAGPAA